MNEISNEVALNIKFMDLIRILCGCNASLKLSISTDTPLGITGMEAKFRVEKFFNSGENDE